MVKRMFSIDQLENMSEQFSSTNQILSDIWSVDFGYLASSFLLMHNKHEYLII